MEPRHHKMCTLRRQFCTLFQKTGLFAYLLLKDVWSTVMGQTKTMLGASEREFVDETQAGLVTGPGVAVESISNDIRRLES